MTRTIDDLLTENAALSARVVRLEARVNAAESDLEAESDWAIVQPNLTEAALATARDDWQPVTDYDLSMQEVHVLCEVTQPETDDFPRECQMPISSGDHAVGDLFVSIGWRDDDGHWYVAGWDMNQDCWTDARCFVVKGWQPLPPSQH